MSKYLAAAKNLADLILAIEEKFGVVSKEITLNVDETVGLIFMVDQSVSVLGAKHWCDSDFHIFCKQNDLNGVIFFNQRGTVTFSMTPKLEENKS